MMTAALFLLATVALGFFLVFALIGTIVKFAFKVAFFPLILVGGLIKLVLLPVFALVGIVLLAVVAPVLLAVGAVLLLPLAAIAGIGWLLA